MLVVLGAAALMLWPLLWPPDPDASVQLVNGRLMGEATGYVGHVDRDAGTVDVSASLVGWRPVVLTVNDATAILVQNRQGGFGDLWKDMPVRVSYEVVGDRRLAKSIEVVTGEGEPSRATVNGSVQTPPKSSSVVPAAPITPSPAAVAPPAVVPPAPAARVAEPAPVRTPTPAPVAPPRAPEPPPVKPPPAVTPSPPSPPPARAALPAAPEKAAPAPEKPAPAAEKPVPAPVVEPPRRVERPAARAAQPQTEAPSAARRPSPGESDPGDGAAAIDWLLKERGGR
jgi:hypothetical protein